MSWATGGLGYNPQIPATRQATRMTFLRDKETPSPRDPADRLIIPASALASASPPSREVSGRQQAEKEQELTETLAPHGQSGDAHAASTASTQPSLPVEYSTPAPSNAGVSEAAADSCEGDGATAQTGALVQNSSFKDELQTHPIVPAPPGLAISEAQASNKCMLLARAFARIGLTADHAPAQGGS